MDPRGSDPSWGVRGRLDIPSVSLSQGPSFPQQQPPPASESNPTTNSLHERARQHTLPLLHIRDDHDAVVALLDLLLGAVGPADVGVLAPLELGRAGGAMAFVRLAALVTVLEADVPAHCVSDGSFCREVWGCVWFRLGFGVRGRGMGWGVGLMVTGRLWGFIYRIDGREYACCFLMGETGARSWSCFFFKKKTAVHIRI